MTKLLEEAIAKLKTLSDEQQDRIAGLLPLLAEGELAFELPDEQIEGIELALRQADNGELNLLYFACITAPRNGCIIRARNARDSAFAR